MRLRHLLRSILHYRTASELHHILRYRIAPDIASGHDINDTNGGFYRTSQVEELRLAVCTVARLDVV